MPPPDRLLSEVDASATNELIDRSPLGHLAEAPAEADEANGFLSAVNPDVSESDAKPESLMALGATTVAEDELYCPQDFCRRLKEESLLTQLSSSQSSEELSLHECVRVSGSTLRGRTGETRQIRTWGGNDDAEVKSKLLQDGYHLTECHVAKAKKDL